MIKFLPSSKISETLGVVEFSMGDIYVDVEIIVLTDFKLMCPVRGKNRILPSCISRYSVVSSQTQTLKFSKKL